VTTNKSLAKKGRRIMKLIKLPASHLQSLMKILLLISTLSLSLSFSAGSWAEWTMLSSLEGDKNYVDFDRIRKVNGLVYYWTLSDYLIPNNGYVSTKVYNELDCNAFRGKRLTYIHYKQPMGEGYGDSNSPDNPKWNYPPPDSVAELTAQAVCAH